MKINLTSVLLLAALLAFFSCQKEKTAPPAPSTDDAQYYTPNLAELTATDRSACDWTTIPAGSVNALAAAIAGACDNGVIYLKAGVHTESAAVLVNKPVKFIGETGAVLKLNAAFSLIDPVTNEYILHPGLHLLNTSNVLVQNLDIQPTGTDGGTAIFMENAPGSCVLKCGITNFQYGVLVQNSDRVAIMQNHIKASGLWQTGGIPEALNVVIINGKSAYVADNEVENALFGIWACDQWGTCERNNAHGNAIGLICCKVPPGGFFTPAGVAIGADQPGNHWKISQNTSTGNFDNGIMVIDGAHHNRIWNNQVHGNGLAPFAGTATDIEIFSDSHLFGFLTPAAHDNFVDASSDVATTIRNCSSGNTVVGGHLVSGGCR